MGNLDQAATVVTLRIACQSPSTVRTFFVPFEPLLTLGLFLGKRYDALGRFYRAFSCLTY
jgi:hypothetical protein